MYCCEYRSIVDVNLKVKKALRQARAARTVAIIIGGFLACWTPYIKPNHHHHQQQQQQNSADIALLDRCWTPYTITTIVAVTTGQTHSYSVNFAVVFLAFASGLVDPIVCVVVNRDFWSSFKALVGLRRRQLLREAAKAFAEAAASGETVWTARQRYMSNGSGSSSDTQEWIVFRDRWNELQRAAYNNRVPLSSDVDERKAEPHKLVS